MSPTNYSSPSSRPRRLLHPPSARAPSPCAPPSPRSPRAQASAATARQAEDRAEQMEAARDDSRFGCGEVACDLHKMEKDLNGTFCLDIHNCNEATIHPANALLIQALQLCSDSTASVQPVLWDHMLHCWASKLEEDAETVFRGVKGRKHIFLLNNTYDVWQLMRRPGAAFASKELMGKLVSLIQPYKKSFLAESWVPLNDTLHANLDEFTAGFVAACDYQRAWKVKAELRYDLREEIVDLIVPPYEAALQVQANRSRLSVSGVLRAIAGKKKQKKCTGEDLKKEIGALFEG
uniref:Uncharacterized protein n=1 Tax=Avena sativa TaxID=4498 RepID=A0ACD5WMB3_AVESA